MMNELDARVFILLGYQDPDLKPWAIECEFTEDLCGQDNFRKTYKRKLRDSGILADWADYIGAAYLGGDNDNNDATNAVVQRTNKKPLLKLPTNIYGEPQLPPISSHPAGTQKCMWLGGMLRTYITICYGRLSEFL
jgi:hypothetical protein